jgi:hypothetical protein
MYVISLPIYRLMSTNTQRVFCRCIYFVLVNLLTQLSITWSKHYTVGMVLLGNCLKYFSHVVCSSIIMYEHGLETLIMLMCCINCIIIHHAKRQQDKRVGITFGMVIVLSAKSCYAV